MAQYDFPTLIEYAISQNEANYAKIVYIGHSEGTTQAFAALSTTPEIADQLYGFVGLGPVIYASNITNVWLKDLLQLDVVTLWNILGFNEFLPTPEKYHNGFVWACAECPLCCNEIVELLCGRHHRKSPGSFHLAAKADERRCF